LNVAQAISLFAAGIAIVVAIVSGIFTYVINERTRDHSVEIETLKGGLNRDIESLRARLGHGQLVSSTQWNAEFEAYQALWKSMVPLRGIANKLVKRDSELAELGLRPGDVTDPHRRQNLQNLIERYQKALEDALRAINNHAPFYPAEIRKSANAVHVLGVSIFQINLSVLIAMNKGQPANRDSVTERAALASLMERMDAVEGMIRERLGSVQVIT
jgi:hypothetical protein